LSVKFFAGYEADWHIWKGMRPRQAEQFAAFQQQRDQEEQERRDKVVAEFGGDPRMMADEILRYRRSLAQIADGIDWMRAGAPFITMGPGPYWKPGSPGQQREQRAAGDQRRP
jgi:hypothetical protein